MHIIIHQMPHVFAGVHEPLKAHLWKPMLKKKKKKGLCPKGLFHPVLGLLRALKSERRVR